MAFGPVSEIWGRKPAVLLPYLPGALFTFAVGASKDIQSILITRFFAGVFSSAPVVNTGGVLNDIWTPTQRATAIVFYAFAVVGYDKPPQTSHKCDITVYLANQSRSQTVVRSSVQSSARRWSYPT
jgi:hypothetical protein